MSMAGWMGVLGWMVWCVPIYGDVDRFQEDAAWFEGLGLVDLRLPFGLRKTTTGFVSETEVVSWSAFLLERYPDGKLHLFSTGLKEYVFDPQERPGGIKLPPEWFEEVSLRDYARERLGDGYKYPPFSLTTEALDLFVLSAACWKQGVHPEGIELYKHAVLLAEKKDGARNFRMQIEDEVALRKYWLAIEGFGEVSVPRSELKKWFAWIVKTFPDKEQGVLSKEWCAVLERMEREERSRVVRTDEELGRLPVERQVSELIFRLRDQNGCQMAEPGECNIFFSNYSFGMSDTPAHRLVALGDAAVPRLIEALEERTPSRSVGRGRHFVFSHRVLTVGDCAEAILSKIAGRDFYKSIREAKANRTYMSESHAEEAVKALVKEWWARR